MKFLWGLLTGAFLGAIFTMWFVNRQMTTEIPDSQEFQETQQEDQVPSDFVAFIDRFSTDSLFQISRISFPLAGLPAYADSTTLAEKSFRYYPEEWVMHKPLNLTDTKFKRDYQVAGEAMVIETLIDSENGFGMQRRFAKLGGEWNLIYYAGVNRIGGGE